MAEMEEIEAAVLAWMVEQHTIQRKADLKYSFLFILLLKKFLNISKKPSIVLIIFCPFTIIVVIIITILIYPSSYTIYIFAASIFIIVYILAKYIIIPFYLFYSNKL